MKKLIVFIFSLVILGSCQKDIEGCTDSTAFNYNPDANVNDGSCEPIIYGCLDSNAINYNPTANTDDGSCEFPPGIGDNFEGGIIFYTNSDGGGLVIAPTDQNDGHWGCGGVEFPGAYGDSLGSGYQNTLDIIAGCTEPNTAAYNCANLNLGGYSDWFLPSKEELNLVYENLVQNSSETYGLDGIYWSSTKSTNYNQAWVQVLSSSGNQYPENKNIHFNVRAIRAF